MAGLLLLTEEEFRRRRQISPAAPHICEEVEAVSTESDLSQTSPLSERQRLSLQLRKLGLREAQVRNQVVLASRDSGKRFTNAVEQRQSVQRISRRVTCSRPVTRTAFAFQPCITRLRVASSVPSTPSTLPSTLPNSLTSSPAPVKALSKPLSKATLQQYLRALEEPRKSKPRTKPRRKLPAQSQPVSPVSLKKAMHLSPKSVSLTTQASPVQSFSLSSPKAKSFTPKQSPPHHKKSQSSGALQPLGRRLLRFAARDPAAFYRAAMNPQLAVVTT